MNPWQITRVSLSIHTFALADMERTDAAEARRAAVATRPHEDAMELMIAVLVRLLAVNDVRAQQVE